VKCVSCNDRDAVRYQRRCQACLQRKHERLNDQDRQELAELLREMATAATDHPALVIALMAAEARLTAPTKGRWFLTQDMRLLAGDVLRASAHAYEEERGCVNPRLEELYRKLLGADRRTGLGPPWVDEP